MGGKRIQKKRFRAWMIKYVLEASSQPCNKCTNRVRWLYSPGTSKYCDDCVPRGCSCMEGLTDRKGREWPCCEYESLEWLIELHGLKIRLN